MRKPVQPEWFPAWTDYPHGSLEESRARQLAHYAVDLETERADLTAEVASHKNLLLIVDRGWGQCRAEHSQLIASLRELKPELVKVKDGLYSNMGTGHCIKYQGRFVELWWKDPNFHGDKTGKEIQDDQTKVHTKLVEMAHAIENQISLIDKLLPVEPKEQDAKV